MDAIKDFVIPLLIAVVSAGMAAILTIKVKYASTEEEAMKKLKEFGIGLVFYGWLIFVIYSLYGELVSTKPLTRASVFLISVLASSLVALIIFRTIKSMLDLLGRILDAQDRHIGITEKLKAAVDSVEPSSER